MSWEVIKVDEEWWKPEDRQYEVEYKDSSKEEKRAQVFARTAQEAVNKIRKKHEDCEVTKVLLHINRWN